jgi:hypothetical protein
MSKDLYAMLNKPRRQPIVTDFIAPDVDVVQTFVVLQDTATYKEAVEASQGDELAALYVAITDATA